MGLATARIAAEKNFEVIIAGRNESKLNEAIQEIGTTVDNYQIDLMNESDVTKMLKNLNPINHIVITVSAPGSATSITATDVKSAKIAFERFWMNYRILHLAKPFMVKNGSITLISGSSSKTPVAGYGFWGTLHGCIEALARNAAIELSPIRVNVVSPGGIGLRPDKQLLEHYGQAEDIGKMIVALIENPAVTNTKVDVDSGERQGTWAPN